MTTLDLKVSHKNSCRFCGKSKRSLIPESFVCGTCKSFIDQQLSEEEMVKRDFESIELMNKIEPSLSQQKFIDNVKASLHSFNHITNEQYLSLDRIYRKGNFKNVRSTFT